MADAVALRRGVHAINPEEQSHLQLCWRTQDSSAVVDSYWMRLSRLGWKEVWSAPITGYEVDVVGGGTACTNSSIASMVTTDAAYEITVYAVDGLKLPGKGASILLLADATAPEPGVSMVSVITGSPTTTHQNSSCCLQLQWDAWQEAESTLTHYSVCFDATGSSCVNVGNTTQVLLQRSACACPERETASAWPKIAYDFPVTVDTGNANRSTMVNQTLASPSNQTATAPSTALGAAQADGESRSVISVRFSIRAHNAVGLSRESNPPTTVFIDEPAAQLVGFSSYNLSLSASEGQILSNSSLTEVDGCPLLASDGCPLFHPAGYALSIKWLSMVGVAHFELCVEGRVGLSSCHSLTGNTTRFTIPLRQLVQAGNYTVSLTATSVGGHSSVISRPLIVDETAPIMGEVGVGGSSWSTAYWGVADGVACHWTAAEDPESGIRVYAIAVLLLKSPAPGRSVDERMQTVATLQAPPSAMNVTLSAALRHGARYKCVVSAVNFAGLRASRASGDFIADFSGSTELSLNSVYISSGSGEQAAGVADLQTVHVSFASQMDVPLAGFSSGNETAL